MGATPRTVEELDALISEPTPGALEAINACGGDYAVLGAGGKLGFHLCLMIKRAFEMLGRDNHVYAVSRFRASTAREEFERAGIPVVAANLCTPVGLNATPMVDNYFYLAGQKFGASTTSDLLHRMNIAMPRMVADHFRHARISALSTGCVYSFTTPESGGSLETGDTNPPGDYARSCLGRELSFRESSELHGTRVALVRLNYAQELRYGIMVDIARKVLNEEPVDVTMGYVNVIWQGDAVAHIIQTLPHASSPPLVINVAGEKVLCVRRIAEAFAERFDQDLEITGEEAPDAWLSNAALSHELFGKPWIPPSDMLDWVADWLEADGETLNKPTHFESRTGRF